MDIEHLSTYVVPTVWTAVKSKSQKVDDRAELGCDLGSV